VANSNNYGSIIIREFDDFEKVLCVLMEPQEWSENLRYSPCGKYLACGSHDNLLYVWEIAEGEGTYTLHSKMDKNSSFITSLDWSADSTMICTNSGSHEKLVYSVADKHFLTHGAYDQTWATGTDKLCWSTQGATPASEDGTHINSCWKTSDDLLLTGDDYGLVNVFNANVLDPSHKARSYPGHSEHVVRV
jgi:microtubule-associated protein-like 1/2